MQPILYTLMLDSFFLFNQYELSQICIDFNRFPMHHYVPHVVVDYCPQTVTSSHHHVITIVFVFSQIPVRTTGWNHVHQEKSKNSGEIQQSVCEQMFLR